MKDTTGPAFPRPISMDDEGTHSTSQDGMTLREYYIGQQTAAWVGALMRSGHTISDIPTDAALYGELTTDAILARLKKEKDA